MPDRFPSPFEVVTPTGAEVLTPGLPKEVDELLALITR